ncbi:ATP-dependent helicase fft2 [Podospora fimiseda]|uniref:ATP-dependent helicase fft2 n=1 Tax=Podospora fimiseda TaxID=252190 RepID=A0AAN7BVW9_9PEZI|nr:ATP-dependent helicase fft2 [Podospora fimiseda]
MAFTSSPPSARHELINLDSDDDDTRLIAESPYFTQATQIIDRPTVNPRPAAGSSPKSIVEVPASSPIMKPKPPTAKPVSRVASLMAPAGTTFKPSTGQKREFIMISDDELDNAPEYNRKDDSSDDDTQPSRGDIRPSSFVRKEPVANASASTGKSRISKSESLGSPVTSPAKPFVLQNDWMNLSSSPDSLERVRKPSPPQPVKRRRLVQGRRPREPSPTSSPEKPDSLPEKTASLEKPRRRLVARAKVIGLVSDDDDQDEEYTNKKDSRMRHSSPGEEEENENEDEEWRILRYLNNFDHLQLAAIAGVKEESAKLMVSHQPFDNIEQARRVVLSQKKKGKKSAKVSIGEDIVSAVKSYARALDDINHVIQTCEDQANIIKASSSKWILDHTGQNRTETARSDPEKPLTPISFSEFKLEDLPYPQPEYMNGHCIMKPFQLYGLNWMRLLYKNRYGGILADDMGLGKTCQVISLMCSVVEEWENEQKGERPWPNIIFVPPSTLANWAAEFKKFAPDLSVITYQGSQSVRDEIAEQILDDPETYHVVLTSYSQVSRSEDISNLRRLKPEIVVFDEGHKMKNPKTKLYKDLLRVTASWRLILSGTPVQNNLMEMIALLCFVEPDLFRDNFENLEALFSQKFSLSAVSQGAILQAERVGRARTILEPFILQRRKEQVLKDMPPKTARVQLCKMDKTQASIYQDYEGRFRKVDKGKSTTGVEKGRDNDTNNVWIQLRKSAIHPQLFRRYFKDRDVEEMAKILMKTVSQVDLRQSNLEHLTNELKALSDFELHLWCRDYKCIRHFDLPDGSWGECAKVKELLKLVRQYQENGDRVLVFTRFAKVIEILGECLASEGIQYLSLQGNTDVSERQQLINEFNEDEDIPVFLLTTGSGGTGINLTAANKVIIFDQSDNPQDDIQAENRAHRLGQTRPVEIIRLISEDTVEELVHKACQKKLELADKVTTGEGIEMSASEMESAVRKELMQKSATTPPNAD